MNDLIFQKVENAMTENEIRYQVFIDNDDLQRIHEPAYMDWKDEDGRDEYLNRFARKELCSYGVVAMKICKCCNAWSEKASLWGIHAESAEEAVSYFKGDGIEEMRTIENFVKHNNEVKE